MQRKHWLWLVAPVGIGLACNSDGLTGPPDSRELVTPVRTIVTAVATPNVSAGWGHHTCALKTDGTVVCWGDNSYGQSTVAAGLPGAIQVSGGGYHTCVLLTDKSVSCWGSNSVGQTSVPATLGDVSQLSSGGFHTCVLKSDGTVVCWGYNNSGQTNVPPNLSGVIQLSAGEVHNCALKNDQTLVCWGDNQYGESNVPPGLTGVIQVSAGVFDTCVLKIDNTIVCWGYNTFGQTNVPANLTTATKVAAGDQLTCALKSDGTVSCWGQSTFVPFLGIATQLSVGVHACAVRSTGTVACWGYSASGETTVPQGLNLIVNVAQTIQFNSAAPSPGYVGDTYSIAATGGGSGNPVIFHTRTPDVCILTRGGVLLEAVGICTIEADQGGGPGYDPAPSTTQSFNVVPALLAQVITFTSAPPNPGLVGGVYSVAATGGGSGNPVTFLTLSSDVCVAQGARIVLLAAGDCSVMADQAGDSVYAPAMHTSQRFTVATGDGTQTISFTSTPPNPALAGGSYTVSATGGGSGNPVTFTSLFTDACTVSGDVVSFVSPGRCSIQADQAGGSGYTAAPEVGQNFTIDSPAQVISFTSSPPSPALADAPYTVTARGGGSGNPIVFSSVTPHVCSVSANSVQFFSVGQCLIAADQAAGNGYDAAPEVTQSFPVDLGLQTITFTSIVPVGALVGQTYNVSATGGPSGNAVTFTSLSPSVCSITSGVVSFNGVGGCRIGADQAGGGGYSPAPRVTQDVVVTGTQSILFTSTPSVPSLTGGTYNVTATGGLSGNSVVFSSLTPSVCSVGGSSVSLIAVGACTLAANQAAGGGYASAPQVTQTFTVLSSAQTISFTSTPPNPALIGGAYNVTATGGASGNAVTFTSLTATVCSVTGSSVSLAAVGTCTIAANQAAGSGYTAAPQTSQSFSVTSPVQTVTFTSAAPNPGLVGSVYNLSATGGASGNPIVFSSTTPLVCGVSGSTASFLKIGSCVIAANQAGGGGYFAAQQVTQSVTVAAAQTITFTSSPPSPATVGSSYTVSATGGGSGNPVLFSSKTPATCTVSNKMVKFVANGACAVAADQAGGGGYLAAAATQTITVYATQTIKFTSSPPAPARVGGTYLVTGLGGGSGNPVVFSSATPSVCSLAGNTVALAASGTCTINANQDGSANFLPATQAIQSFKIK